MQLYASPRASLFAVNLNVAATTALSKEQINLHAKTAAFSKEQINLHIYYLLHPRSSTRSTAVWRHHRRPSPEASRPSPAEQEGVPYCVSDDAPHDRHVNVCYRPAKAKVKN